MSEANLVSSNIWLNKKFRPLPSNSKLIYLYLCCNPRVSVSGVYHINFELIAFELHAFTKQDIETAFNDLEIRNLIAYDRNKDLVWIVGKIDFEKSYNSPTKHKAILKQLYKLRGSFFEEAFYSRYCQFIDFNLITEKEERKAITHNSSTLQDRTEQNIL